MEFRSSDYDLISAALVIAASDKQLYPQSMQTTEGTQSVFQQTLGRGTGRGRSSSRATAQGKRAPGRTAHAEGESGRKRTDWHEFLQGKRVPVRRGANQ
jgi:hypothetical protein